MGRSEIAPEVLNGSAPDTGNMEVFARYGSDAQKEKWLKPLLEGKIRSAFIMTEPNVASSDATNIESRIERDGAEYVINGHKWWASGAGDPRCKIFIFMGKTDPKADRHKQQSMILIEPGTKGIEIIRLAVRSGLYPIYEVCHGYELVLNIESELSAQALRKYYEAQGRFKLEELDLREIEQGIGETWERLRLARAVN